jgi:alpha-amylase/alpha-mannosidase (GH57 family)
MATDEGIHSKTGVRLHEDRRQLYQPYERHGLTLFFRDREISDMIGFQYMHWNPRDAATDLVRRLREMPDGSHVTVALDGENPWDYYPENGRQFLRLLFDGIAREPRLEAVTLSESCVRLPRKPMDWLAPGSWANANFSIWIGHPEDHQAWEWIVRARTALMEHKTTAPAERWEQAYEELLVAEGSDWMWWFGNDFSSDSDAIFDALFRRHIGNIYELIGLPQPQGLDQPIKKSLGGRNAVMV